MAREGSSGPEEMDANHQSINDSDSPRHGAGLSPMTPGRSPFSPLRSPIPGRLKRSNSNASGASRTSPSTPGSRFSDAQAHQRQTAQSQGSMGLDWLNKRTDTHGRFRTQFRNSLRFDTVLNHAESRNFDAGSFLTTLVDFKDGLEAKQSRDLEYQPMRKSAYVLCRSRVFQTTMALVIVGHICIGVHDTNLRAEKKSSPEWLIACEICVLAAYLVEIFTRMFSDQLLFFLQPWNLFDFFIVMCDMIMSVTTDFHGVSILRSIRLLRVFRVLKRFVIFREVYLITQGVNSALRTLIFGTIIGFAIMTSWSLLAVEILDPLVKELAAKGALEGCEKCENAFSSVMAANLTFFRGIVAGDSWGQISVPLMENYPQAAVLLMLVFLTLELGVVSIIIAVIVDRVREAHENDSMLRTAVQEENLRKSYRQLWKVFKSIDDDKSGQISIEEMMNAYKYNPQFKALMNSMDFTSDNMNLFFDIIDLDHSGEVTYDEFVEQIHMIKAFDSHTLMVIIRHLVQKLHDHIDVRLDDHFVAVQNVKKSVQKAMSESKSISAEAKCSKEATSASKESVVAAAASDVCQEEISYCKEAFPRHDLGVLLKDQSRSALSADCAYERTANPVGTCLESEWTTMPEDHICDKLKLAEMNEHRAEIQKGGIEFERTARPDDQLCVAEAKGHACENYDLCMRILQHIHALEANMYQVVERMGDRVDQSQSELATSLGAAISCKFEPEDEILRHSRTGLSQQSELRQMKRSMLKYVSELTACQFVEDGAPEAIKLSSDARLLTSRSSGGCGAGANITLEQSAKLPYCSQRL